MERAARGYTIIEVMLVLAISGVLLISAIALFRGNQGETQFSQAMHDIDSKIQSYVNDVGVSVFPDAQKYSCQTSGSSHRPYLSNALTGNQATGSNQACLFLGKAIQVTTGQGTIHVYTVLGNRLKTPAFAEPVTTFNDASPEPAVDASGNFITALIDDYDIALNAATVTSSRISTTSDPPGVGAPEADLVGFYNSLQTASQSGNQSLLAKGYTVTNPGQPTIKNCIEETACSPSIIQGWYICFSSRSNDNTAQLVITATPAGVNTKLNFVSCT